ncbi:MAG: methyltransferase domain-containing protein [Steroidobacteraceae bacterium]|nr:methyltransferase domain-containing protein [Steroidobacteraceae bacterium]
MNAPATRGEQARRFYDAAATAADNFSFMNYGFAPLMAELVGADEPERYCLQLYRHLVGDFPTGKRIVEVSCGRGGGAAHLARVLKPTSYVGIDISEQNVRLAREKFSSVPNLSFTTGNAEALPLPAESCDAVVNVEAAHLYDNPTRFFAEVARVLDPAGRFFHADLAWRDKDPVALIEAAGFVIESTEDITGNVLEALRLDSERREEIVTRFPENLRADFRDWSGVRGHRAYNRLESGEWVYRAVRAKRR